MGLEIELRDNPEILDSEVLEELAKVKQKPVTKEEGEKLARELRAVKYVECSALTQKGLKNVMEEAILAALEPPEPKRRRFTMPKISSFPSLFKRESCCVSIVRVSHVMCK